MNRHRQYRLLLHIVRRNSMRTKSNAFYFLSDATPDARGVRLAIQLLLRR